MGRALFRFILVSLCLLSIQSVHAIMNVFDSSNYANITQLIASNGKQLNEQKLTTAGLECLNSSLGSALPFNFSSLEHMMHRKSFSLSDFSLSQYDIPGFETRKRDFTSYRRTMQESLLGRFNDKGVLSHETREMIGERREGLFKESVLSGLALSAQQKESLQTSQAELTSILKHASLSRDLRSDVAITNRFLALLVNETIQTRALLLQQLEMESSRGARTLPISLKKRSTPQSNEKSLRGFLGKGVS